MKRFRIPGIHLRLQSVTLQTGALEAHERISRRRGLQRFFSTFPGGWPCVGLLLLRAAVGLTAVVQGGFFLTDRGNQTLTNWVIGLTAVPSGALLLIGFLTPIVGMLVGLGSAGIALSWPAPTLHLLDSWLVTVFVVIMAAALVFLGPGACSLDCRLFGRREILIPPAPRPPKS